MSIIYVLIPIAILFVIIAIGIFFWAVKSEQFSDLNKQGHSILFDDDKVQTGDKSLKPSNNKSNNDN
ncbi:cbb3-type cytochrome oxidase assembly protein CcoS [Pseudoalteromonas sp. DY56-GL79]|uniref:cbb3-type cytochrome oxidase assembly protein CcoS n=1 Tax=Pseudoalteromonas sp. DY56-GL79 TaxID=2967131 RepID=UPI00352B6CB9